MSEMTMRCVWVRDAKGNYHERTHHDRMDGWMEAQSFADDTVQNREFLHFFICHRTKSSIRVGEMFQLFLMQSPTENMVNRGRRKLSGNHTQRQGC